MTRNPHDSALSTLHSTSQFQPVWLHPIDKENKISYKITVRVRIDNEIVKLLNFIQVAQVKLLIRRGDYSNDKKALTRRIHGTLQSAVLSSAWHPNTLTSYVNHSCQSNSSKMQTSMGLAVDIEHFIEVHVIA